MPFGISADTAGAPPRAPAKEGRQAEGPALGDSDLELLAAFRQGRGEAFDRLYERHQEYVYNICLGVVADRDDARDCTQETFLRVFRKAGEFRGEAAFSTWIYRIAVNVSVGHLRRRPKAADASLEDERVREAPSEEPDPLFGMQREVDGVLVRRLVAQLPPDYRTVLVLRYFQDESYEEMQRILGYSLGQVKVKLHRARRAFARLYARQQQEALGRS